jgi:hypothetical protein
LTELLSGAPRGILKIAASVFGAENPGVFSKVVRVTGKFGCFDLPTP